MRGLKALVVVCAALAAQGAGAQEEDAGAQGTAPRWSVGAGLGLGGTFLDAGTWYRYGGGALVGFGGLSGLVGRASLEYLLSEDLALVLGGAGTYARLDNDAYPEPWTAYGLGANVGLRKYVAGAGATRASVHGLLSASFAHREGPINILTEGLSEERVRGGWVGGGFAVDRVLLEGLSLRASVDLLSVGYSRTRVIAPPSVGAPPVETTSNAVSASFFFSPSLELRLAF